MGKSCNIWGPQFPYLKNRVTEPSCQDQWEIIVCKVPLSIPGINEKLEEHFIPKSLSSSSGFMHSIQAWMISLVFLMQSVYTFNRWEPLKVNSKEIQNNFS